MNKFITGLYISLASSKHILLWSSRIILNELFIGNVLVSKTINYKNGLPYKGGLFCEEIFGPLKNWCCKCKKYLFFIKSFICKKCFTEVNINTIRKYRLGSIKFITPVFHTWYFKKNYNVLSIILNCSENDLNNLIYYKKCFEYKFIFYNNFFEFYIDNNFNVIKQLFFINEFIYYYLNNISILEELYKCRELLLNNNNKFTIKKIFIYNTFYVNKLKLSWLILDIISVLSAGLRPINKLSNNTYICSFINKLYRNIIDCNNKLKQFVNLRNLTPIFFEIIEKRNLQKSLDLLFINNKSTGVSLSSNLLGKYGRFRENLLGKRIDFSGRSVIISGPDLNFNMIGVPISLAINLFKPLIKKILHTNINLYKLLYISKIYYTSLIIKRIILRIFKFNYVLINRAPTLHRMNIQACIPYLIEGFSIKLYPLSCYGYNADFDGDQMSLIMSLTKSSINECSNILLSDKNILSPVTGDNIYKLRQSIVLGIYTSYFIQYKLYKYILSYYNNIYSIIFLYFKNIINFNTPIWFKNILNNNNIKYYYFILTTVSRLILNTSCYVKNEYIY